MPLKIRNGTEIYQRLVLARIEQLNKSYERIQQENSRLQSQMQTITQERNCARNELRELEEKYENAEIRLALLSNNLPESEFKIVDVNHRRVEYDEFANAFLFARYKVKTGDYAWMLCDRGWRGDGSCMGNSPNGSRATYEMTKNESKAEWIQSLVDNGLKRYRVPKDKEVLWADVDGEPSPDILGTYDSENDSVIPIRETHCLPRPDVLRVLDWHYSSWAGFVNQEEITWSSEDLEGVSDVEISETQENLAHSNYYIEWRPKETVDGYTEVWPLECN